MFHGRSPVGIVFCACVLCIALSPPMAGAEDFRTAVQLTLNESPEIEAARKDVQVAESQYKVVIAEYLPQLSGSLRTGTITEDYSDSSDTYEETIGSLSLSQEIVDVSKYYSIKKAESEVDVAKAELENRKQTVLLAAAKVWGAYWRTLRQLEVNDENVSILAAFVEGTELRYEAGELTLADVQLAKTRHEAALSQRNRFLRNIAAARDNYRQIMLAPAPPDIALPDIDINSFPLPDDEQAVSDHPSIRPIKNQLEASKMDVKRQRAGHYPTMGLESSVSHQTSGEYATTRYPYNESTIGLVVEIPIFSGGSVYYSTDRAQSAQGSLLARMRDLHDKLVRDLNTARSNYAVNIDEIETARNQVEYAEKTLEWMQEEFKLGTRTSMDVFLAQSAMIDARLQLTVVQEERFTFIMDYLYALGILPVTVEDVVNTN